VGDATIQNWKLYMRRFLAFRFGNKLGDLNAVTPGDIVAFLGKLKAGPHHYSYKGVPSHLRNFFKFLFWSGKTKCNLAKSYRVLRNLRPATFLAISIQKRSGGSFRRTNQTTGSGRRDLMLLMLALQTGLRVSEVIGLNCGDIALGTSAHVRCMGKGRKERSTPLRKDCVEALRRWLSERRGADHEPLFISNRGDRLSRDAVERIDRKHVALASLPCPTLKGKRVTPHVLRHSAAM
jgi:site-specific recombinase XerD